MSVLPEHITVAGRELVRIGSAMILNEQNPRLLVEALNLIPHEFIALVAIGCRHHDTRPAIITEAKAKFYKNATSYTHSGHEDITITIRHFI